VDVAYKVITAMAVPDHSTIAEFRRRHEAALGELLVGVLVGPAQTFDRKLAVGGELGRIPILEVVMRPTEVFVRSLSHQEAVRLKRTSTRADHQSTRIRAAILLASNVRTPVPPACG
jgi:hypothetical protein